MVNARGKKASQVFSDLCSQGGAMVKNIRNGAAQQEENEHAQGSAMEIDGARLLPEFDAVYAWTSRDRAIIERMTT